MRRSCRPLSSNRFLVTGCGQSLIEVVISIALAAILAISLISTTLVTQRTSQSAKNSSEATKIAQELVEQLRVFRDRQGYDQILASACRLDSTNLNPDLWTLQSAGCDNDYIVVGTTTFYRQFSVVDQGDTKQVALTIGWDESGGHKEVRHDTVFSRWDQF